MMPFPKNKNFEEKPTCYKCNENEGFIFVQLAEVKKGKKLDDTIKSSRKNTFVCGDCYLQLKNAGKKGIIKE